MYVCICNAINERQVRAALEQGVDSVLRVYRHYGCAPRCGKCLPTMKALVAQHRAPAAPVGPAPAVPYVPAPAE